MTERMRSLPMGVVIERREVDHPWANHEWRPVALLPGAPDVNAWREIAHGDGWVRYHAATLALELHRSATEAYRTNLSDNPPVIYVVLRPGDNGDAPAGHEVVPFMVTASPYEAQDYLDSDDIVEGVVMPDLVIAWVQNFVITHHVDEPFTKRKRKRLDPEEVGFARRPDGPARPNGAGDG